MKIIITGATGMIGEGVLRACLDINQVTEILSVSRKALSFSHPKLKEYVVTDFLKIDLNDPKLKGYDACFFCAGISSVGISADQYYKITYETTLHFAQALNPNPNMIFIYVSGGGTDSSEKGWQHWARVKGKTENDLQKLGFRQSFGYRIGFVKPHPQQISVHKYYSYIKPLFPVIKNIFPFMYNDMNEVAQSMIYLVNHEYTKTVIQVKDIHILHQKFQELKH